MQNNIYKNIRLVLLISEEECKSIEESVPKLFRVDPNAFDFQFKDNKIVLIDGLETISINSDQAKKTILLIKKGYGLEKVVVLANRLKEMGCLILNEPEAVKISSDKYLLYKKLEENKIRQPKSVLVSSGDIHKDDTKKFDEKISKIYSKIDDNTKFVCKLLNGHGGKGVFVCRKKNITSILQCIFAIDEKVKILVQEYIKIEQGDIRLHILTINGKQKVIDSSMRKKSTKDFRTNLSLGNDQVDNYSPSDNVVRLALDTAKASGLIWCGVDIIPTKSSGYVIEYNGAPGTPVKKTISDEELMKKNTEFYLKLFKTIDEML